MSDLLKSFTQAAPANSEHLPKINTIFDFNAESLGQLRTWLEQNPPSIPVTQILGFSQFTAQAATTIQTLETTTSTTYTDLATVGPTITGLSDGNYLVVFGAMVATDAASTGATMAVQVNATSPSSTDALTGLSTSLVPGAYVTLAALNNGGNNTLTAKYKTDGAAHTASFQRRWLVALRYSNL